MRRLVEHGVEVGRMCLQCRVSRPYVDRNRAPSPQASSSRPTSPHPDSSPPPSPSSSSSPPPSPPPPPRRLRPAALRHPNQNTTPPGLFSNLRAAIRGVPELPPTIPPIPPRHRQATGDTQRTNFGFRRIMFGPRHQSSEQLSSTSGPSGQQNAPLDPHNRPNEHEHIVSTTPSGQDSDLLPPDIGPAANPPGQTGGPRRTTSRFGLWPFQGSIPNEGIPPNPPTSEVIPPDAQPSADR